MPLARQVFLKPTSQSAKWFSNRFPLSQTETDPNAFSLNTPDLACHVHPRRSLPWPLDFCKIWRCTISRSAMGNIPIHVPSFSVDISWNYQRKIMDTCIGKLWLLGQRGEWDPESKSKWCGFSQVYQLKSHHWIDALQ